MSTFRDGGDEFDLEAVGVGEVNSAVLGSTGVGVRVGEKKRPSVIDGIGDEPVGLGDAPRVEGEMVEPGAEPVVGFAGQRRGSRSNTM